MRGERDVKIFLFLNPCAHAIFISPFVSIPTFWVFNSFLHDVMWAMNPESQTGEGAKWPERKGLWVTAWELPNKFKYLTFKI